MSARKQAYLRTPSCLRTGGANVLQGDASALSAGEKTEPTNCYQIGGHQFQADVSRVLDVQICGCHGRPEARSSIDTAASLSSSKESATQMVLYGPVTCHLWRSACTGATGCLRGMCGLRCS